MFHIESANEDATSTWRCDISQAVVSVDAVQHGQSKKNFNGAPTPHHGHGVVLRGVQEIHEGSRSLLGTETLRGGANTEQKGAEQLRKVPVLPSELCWTHWNRPSETCYI